MAGTVTGEGLGTGRATLRLLLRPLRTDDTALWPSATLLVRMLALVVVVHPVAVFGPGVPFIELFELLPDGTWPTGGRRVLTIAALVILWTPAVRIGAALAGTTLLATMVACAACVSVAHSALGLVFVILACCSERVRWPLRAQLVVIYLGAALAKILDRDWWDGDTMDAMLVGRYGQPLATAVFDALPFAATALGVGVIATEVAIGLLLIGRTTTAWGVLLAAALHAAITVVFGITFGPFLALGLLATIALLELPTPTWTGSLAAIRSTPLALGPILLASPIAAVGLVLATDPSGPAAVRHATLAVVLLAVAAHIGGGDAALEHLRSGPPATRAQPAGVARQD